MIKMAGTADKTKTVPYDVAEQLRTPEEMAAYLDAWLTEAPEREMADRWWILETHRIRDIPIDLWIPCVVCLSAERAVDLCIDGRDCVVLSPLGVG